MCVFISLCAVREMLFEITDFAFDSFAFGISLSKTVKKGIVS